MTPQQSIGAAELRRRDAQPRPPCEHRASITRAAKMTRVAAYHNVRSLRPADRTHHRAQPDLMAVVGHELRSPLAALVVSADLITDGLDDLDRQQLVHMLATIQQRARGLQVL